MLTAAISDPSPDGNPGRFRQLAGSLAFGALVLGAAGVGLAGVAGATNAQIRTPVTEQPSTWQAVYVGCMRRSASTPDSLEHHVEFCVNRASALFTRPQSLEGTTRHSYLDEVRPQRVDGPDRNPSGIDP